MLEEVKLALRISTSAFDNELNLLIESAKQDIGLANVNSDKTDSIIKRAIITYCKMNFGEPSDYDRLKASYDEQKMQLGMSTSYRSSND